MPAPIKATIKNNPSYKEVREQLGSRDNRKIGYHTHLQREEGGSIALTLYGNKIIRWKPDGSVFYNTAGYRTQNTRRRLNQFGPVPVRRDWTIFHTEHGEKFLLDHAWMEAQPADKPFDVVGFIMDVEMGDIPSEQWLIDGLTALRKSGTLNSLQGSWQRLAERYGV